MSEGQACPLPDPNAPLTEGAVLEMIVQAIRAEGLPVTSRNIIKAACGLVARHCRRREGKFVEHVSGHLGHPGSL